MGNGVLGVSALRASLPVRHHALSQHRKCTCERPSEPGRQCQCSSPCPSCQRAQPRAARASLPDLAGSNESTLLQPSLSLKYIYLPCGHDQIPHPAASPVLQAVAESEGFVALLCNVLVPCTLLVTRIRQAVNAMLHRKAPLSKVS